MISLRKILGFLVAVVLVAFALPASAADKLFLLNLRIFNGGVETGSISTLPSAPSVVLLDIANQSPSQAASVIKSVLLNAPSGVQYQIISNLTKVVNGIGSSCPITSLASPTTYSPGTPSLRFENLAQVKPRGHFCVYIAAHDTSSVPTCTLQSWQGQANTGSNFGGGTPFEDINTGSLISYANIGSGACTGVLGCTSTNNKAGALDPTDDLAYADTADQGKYGLIRGNNKDGGACIVVPYQFNLNIGVSPQTASFIVPTGTGQKVAAQYVVVWGAVKVLPSPYPALSDVNAGWTMNRPKVAWVKDGFGVPVYVPALSCVEDPADFSLVPSAGLAALLPVIPNAPPFNTPALAGYPHYQPGEPAKMCVSQHGWTSVGRDTLTNDILVQYWTKVIDQADGFMTND